MRKIPKYVDIIDLPFVVCSNEIMRRKSGHVELYLVVYNIYFHMCGSVCIIEHFFKGIIIFI